MTSCSSVTTTSNQRRVDRNLLPVYVIFITTTVKEYKKAQAQFVRGAASVKVF